MLLLNYDEQNILFFYGKKDRVETIALLKQKMEQYQKDEPLLGEEIGRLIKKLENATNEEYEGVEFTLDRNV